MKKEELCKELEKIFKKEYEDATVEYKEIKHNRPSNIYENLIEQTIKKLFVVTFFQDKEKTIVFQHEIHNEIRDNTNIKKYTTLLW